MSSRPGWRATVGFIGRCAPDACIPWRNESWHPVVVRTTTRPAGLRVGAILWIVAGIWYLATEACAARRLSGYSYSSDYISDLGRPLQSPLAGWMNGAFIAQGAAFALAALVVVATARLRPGTMTFAAFALTYGAGSALVGLVPSGGTGTASLVHFAGAFAAIVGGNLAVITAGVVLLRGTRFRAAGLVSVTLGILGLICGGLLLCDSVFNADVPFGDGVWERVAVYTIIGWQLLAGCAVVLTKLPAHKPDSAVDPLAPP